MSNNSLKPIHGMGFFGKFDFRHWNETILIYIRDNHPDIFKLLDTSEEYTEIIYNIIKSTEENYDNLIKCVTPVIAFEESINFYTSKFRYNLYTYVYNFIPNKDNQLGEKELRSKTIDVCIKIRKKVPFYEIDFVSINTILHELLDIVPVAL